MSGANCCNTQAFKRDIKRQFECGDVPRCQVCGHLPGDVNPETGKCVWGNCTCPGYQPRPEL